MISSLSLKINSELNKPKISVDIKRACCVQPSTYQYYMNMYSPDEKLIGTCHGNEYYSKYCIGTR